MNLSKVNEGRKRKIEEYYSNKIKNVELLIDNVWDPHNVAAIARTADGLGIERINLHYTYNKFPNLKELGKKSSSSTNKWINFEKIENLDKFTEEKKKHGFDFIGACWKDNAEDLRKIVFPDKCVLIFGSESKGLSSEIESICSCFDFIGACWKDNAEDLRKIVFPDKCVLIFGSESKGLSSEIESICSNFVFIPMVGMAESYNVSVAAALLMYKIFEQKGAGLKLRIKDTIRKV